jgi:tol-pal system protein YbgF
MTKETGIRQRAMKVRATATALTIGLVVAGLPAAARSDSDLESRVARLERILSSQTISDLVLQVQRLQSEVDKLRGRLDVQQHDIEMLQQARGQATSGPGANGSAAPRDDGSQPAPSGDTDTPAGDGLGASSGERTLYRNAFSLLKEKRFDEAVAAFKELLAQYPKGQFADNAHYWLGEIYYVKQQYPAALAEFKQIIQRYPLSPKVPGAMLKVGYIYYEQGDWARARSVLQQVIAKFPDSNEGGFAQSRLDRMTREGH